MRPPTRTTNAVIDHVEHFQHRIIQDALADATASYWERRAEWFEWARPRPGDYTGRSTEADLRKADERCKTTAEACRVRARAAVILDREMAA